MTPIEDRLTIHLHRRAAEGEVRFTVADVIDRAGGREPGHGDRRRTRPVFLAAVAAAIVIGAGFGVWFRVGSSQNQRTDVGTAARIDSLEEAGRLMTLTRSNDAARELSNSATVLQAKNVGPVEVGPPSERLVEAQPWLADGHCVATQAVVGCVAVADQQSGRRQTLAISNDGGFHVIQDTGSQRAILVYGSTPTPTLAATLLPEDAALVVASFDGERIGQVPVEQTAAFALPTTARSIHVEIYDGIGNRIDQTAFDLPEGPLDGLIGDEPAGEGVPGGEEISPTTNLGSEAIWPEPLELGGPRAVAERLAAEILGWGDPVITVDSGAAADGPTWVIVAAAGRKDVRLLTVPFGSEGWGAVQIGEPTSITTVTEPDGVLLDISQVPAATEVVLYIADKVGNTRSWSAGLTNYSEPQTVMLFHVELDQIATALLIYNDSMGRSLEIQGGQFGN